MFVLGIEKETATCRLFSSDSDATAPSSTFLPQSRFLKY
nr:MAG TPA: hypothetical protein [Caudoviricetes sp.]